MAYIEPKTNWVANNAPVQSDFNRIEGNTKQNHDDVVAANADIVAEVAARIADVNAEETARTAAVSAEASTRSAADSSLQSQINTKTTKAVIGNNGGVGSVITITSTYVQVTSGIRNHTWAMPRSGVWFFVNPPVGMPIIFSGASTSVETSNIAQQTCQFWQIG